MPSRTTKRTKSVLRQHIEAVRPRIKVLLATLNVIKHSLGARMLMQKIWLQNGRYCVSCSLRGVPGECGRRCALLRPIARERIFARGSEVKARAHALRADCQTYSHALRELTLNGGERCSKSVVARWERHVARLKRECETPTERMERRSWKLLLDKQDKSRVEVLKEGWELETAWGKGVDEEESVAPEVKMEVRKGKVKVEEKSEVEVDEKNEVKAAEKSNNKTEEKSKIETDGKSKVDTNKKSKVEIEEKKKVETNKKSKVQTKEMSRTKTADEKSKVNAERKSKAKTKEKTEARKECEKGNAKTEGRKRKVRTEEEKSEVLTGDVVRVERLKKKRKTRIE